MLGVLYKTLRDHPILVISARAIVINYVLASECHP